MKYDENIKNQVKEMYLSGLNSVEISNRIGIKTGTITYWLRKFGISRHRGPKSKIGNEEYFDVIDTERKAYYLGWIMADGNVSIYNGQYSLKIHISYKDKDIVDAFLLDIKSTNKASKKSNTLSTTGNQHESYYVSLTSVHMCKQLISLGVIPNKTGHEIIPSMPKDLIPHFIRGFFDGDGITDCKYEKRSGFVSNRHMLESILKHIDYHKQISLHPHHTTPYIYYFLGGIEFSKHLYEYIYKDATIFIERKKNNMNVICGYDS